MTLQVVQHKLQKGSFRIMIAKYKLTRYPNKQKQKTNSNKITATHDLRRLTDEN